MRRVIALLFLLAATSTATADAPKEKASIVSIDLGKGVQEMWRAKASAQVQQGLMAAGYDVVAPEPKNKTTAQVTVNITRKLDSTIIVMKMVDPSTGDAIADIHEVCDLCGQEELEERIGVAASALRAKATAERSKRQAAASALATSAPQPPPATTIVAQPGPLHVAIVPGIAVNMDTARVDALSQDLAEALNAELDVVATGGLEVRRQLPADGLPADCVTNPSCTNDVARRTGATQLLFVVMVDTGAGGSIQIDSTWIDAVNGQNASRPAIDLTSAAEAKAKFASSAKLLLPDAPVRAKPTTGGGGFGNATMTEAAPRHFTTPAKITAAAGVVGLGVGIALGLQTRSRYNKCDNDPVNCTSSDKDSIRRFGLIADSGFIVATGCAIATVILYATSAKESQMVVAPTPTADGSGAALMALGRF